MTARQQDIRSQCKDKDWQWPPSIEEKMTTVTIAIQDAESKLARLRLYRDTLLDHLDQASRAKYKHADYNQTLQSVRT